jgi:hypothetical protein
VIPPTTTSVEVEDYSADPVHHDAGTSPGEGLKQFEKYVDATIRYEASDLIIKVDLPPRIRVRGSLKSLQTELCTPPMMFQLAKDLLDDHQYKHFHHHGQIDFAYDYDDDNRFRVNLFMARGKPSLAARLITSNIRRFEDLFRLGQEYVDRVDAAVHQRAQARAHRHDRGSDRVHLQGLEGDDQPARSRHRLPELQRGASRPRAREPRRRADRRNA